MSKIEEVAKLLCLELGEKFNIDGKSYNPHHFEEGGLIDSDGDVIDDALGDIITHPELVKYITWKPKDKEEFWFVASRKGLPVSHITLEYNDCLLVAMVLCGNCYRTKTQAEKARPYWEEKYKEFMEGELK